MLEHDFFDLKSYNERQIVFSVLPKDYEAMTKLLIDNDYQFIEGTGCYKGELEKCYIVDEQAFSDLSNNEMLLTQESILVLEPASTRAGKRNARLSFNPLTIEREGLKGNEDINMIWYPVAKETALKQDGYTLVAGQYYTLFTEEEFNKYIAQ